MALASQSALLDELMGRNRNEKKSSSRKLRWYDEGICKLYLAGYCPHEMFINTKVDMGPCELIHDDRLVDEYKESRDFKRMGYEDDLKKMMEKMVYESDRKIVTNKRRLKENGSTVIGGLVVERKRMIDELSEKIEILVKEVEKLGNEGKIMECKTKMTLCDELQLEKRFFENDIEIHSNNAKEMEVCEICGAMQVKNDIELRVKEHEAGRMHVGYSKVREVYEQLKNNPPLTKESRSHKPRSKEKSREKESRHHHSEDKDRQQRDNTDHHRSHRHHSSRKHDHRSRSREKKSSHRHGKR